MDLVPNLLQNKSRGEFWITFRIYFRTSPGESSTSNNSNSLPPEFVEGESPDIEDSTQEPIVGES